MQEIAPHIYIETAYSGVTLGAIAWDHGIILIDSPLKADDARSWRASMLNMGSNTDRLLVNLDAHVDRTLGVRAMDCTVMGHEEIAEAFRSRPLTFKAQSGESGAEWELYDGIGNTRWAPPEITFTQNLIIHWNDHPIILEQWTGPAIGSICIRLPEDKIIFIGDMVTPHQPPFLAEADLTTWTDNLVRLAGPDFEEFMIISGRGGLIQQTEVKTQLKFLRRVEQQLETLAAQKAAAEATAQLVPGLLGEFQVPHERKNLFQRRLQFGLKQYYQHHYLHTETNSSGVSL
jgi:cyclase